MSRVKKLSIKTVNKLAHVADVIDEKIASGEDKITAFVTTAREFNLSPEQIHILSRGWNISNFLSKLASSKDLFARLNYEDAVYINEILDKLEQHKKESVLSDLNSPEKKTAVIDPMYYNAPPRPEVEIDDPFLNLKDDTQKRFEEVEEKVAVDKNIDALTFTIEKLVEEIDLLNSQYFLKQAEFVENLNKYRLDIDILKANLRTLNPDYCAEVEKVENRLIKFANFDTKFIPFDEKHPVYSSIIDCTKLAKLIKKSNDFLNVLNKRLKTIQKLTDGIKFAEKQEREVDFRPFLVSHDEKLKYPGGYITTKEGKRRDKEERKEKTEQKPVKLEELAGGLAAILPERPPKEYRETRYIEELKKPQVSLPLDLARGITLVTKLYTSDEILSKYSPKEVYAAFLQLSTIAPKAMLQESLAKTLLQKYLAQGGILDIYDFEKLVKINGILSEKPGGRMAENLFA